MVREFAPIYEMDCLLILKIEERRGRLIRWLCPNNYFFNTKHEESTVQHTAGTGEWLFEDVKIRNWMSIKGSKLWIHGIPGAGKTILA